jgi:diketogulonate reductase-like aldo/keto reductase
MEEASALPGGDEIATDQVLYNVKHRGIEWDLLPWCCERGIPVMAYSPVGNSPTKQRGMLDHPSVKRVSSRHGTTPAQVALAWLLRQKAIVTIPKAASAAHVRENRAALELRLTDEDLMELDRAFPPPHKKMPLKVL